MLPLFHHIFNGLPSVAGLLLATLAIALGFIKELDEKLKSTPIRWAMATILCAIGITALISDIKQKNDADIAHQAEIQKQEKDMKDIREQLRATELSRISDTRFLEGQLKVFSDFAPAIFKLAQATEINTRKQYEAKVMSNRQLRDFTANVVKRMRDLSYKYQQNHEQLSAKYWAALQQAKDEQQRRQVTNQHSQDEDREYNAINYEFKTTILADAIQARDELLRRIAHPQISGHDAYIDSVFRGFLAGPDPVGDAATYLEKLAKQLVP